MRNALAPSFCAAWEDGMGLEDGYGDALAKPGYL